MSSLAQWIWNLKDDAEADVMEMGSFFGSFSFCTSPYMVWLKAFGFLPSVRLTAMVAFSLNSHAEYFKYHLVIRSYHLVIPQELKLTDDDVNVNVNVNVNILR